MQKLNEQQTKAELARLAKEYFSDGYNIDDIAGYLQVLNETESYGVLFDWAGNVTDITNGEGIILYYSASLKKNIVIESQSPYADTMDELVDECMRLWREMQKTERGLQGAIAIVQYLEDDERRNFEEDGGVHKKHIWHSIQALADALHIELEAPELE